MVPRTSDQTGGSDGDRGADELVGGSGADLVTGVPGADVVNGGRGCDFVQGDEGIVRELAARSAAEAAHRDEVLDALEISRADLDTQDDAVGALLRMLNRRAHVRF